MRSRGGFSDVSILEVYHRSVMETLLWRHFSSEKCKLWLGGGGDGSFFTIKENTSRLNLFFLVHKNPGFFTSSPNPPSSCPTSPGILPRCLSLRPASPSPSLIPAQLLVIAPPFGAAGIIPAALMRSLAYAAAEVSLDIWSAKHLSGFGPLVLHAGWWRRFARSPEGDLLGLCVVVWV